MATKLELAWLAGLVDGEGCITFSPHQRGRKWVLKFHVSNTHMPTVRRAWKILGRQGYLGRRDHNGKGWKPLFVLELSEKKAEYALTVLMPYLVTKKEQAELGLYALRFRRLANASRQPGSKFPERVERKLTLLTRQMEGLKSAR